MTTNDPLILRENLWKNYSYHFSKDTITIKGFDYEKLLYKEGTLVYFFKLENDSLLPLNFIKE